MAEVAALAGVHQTTVSLALRGKRGVSAETVARVRRAADRLGYRRDPLLDAFIEHRRGLQLSKTESVIGCIVDDVFLATTPPGSYAEMRWRGIVSAALEYGLRIERFVIGPDRLSVNRLDGILAARNIEGVIVAGLDRVTAGLPLSWDRLAAVCIESHQLDLNLDRVSADQRQAVRLAVRRLRDLGYRRIGLATAREDEEWLDRSMSSGYLIESLAIPEEERIPPHLFTLARGPLENRNMADWIRKHRIDVVISNWGNIPEVLEQNGWKVPGGMAFASIDLEPVRETVAGVVQNHEEVGRLAVEHLAILMQAHRHGGMEAPATTFIPGYWRDGLTAPRQGSADSGG